MLLKINPQNPEPSKIKTVIEILKQGGVIIYPTDTVYGLGCDIFNKKAINKIHQIKKSPKKKPMSIVCSDFKDASQYARIPDASFKAMKKLLPGPYTFILKALSKTPSNFISKNKTVGIRIPDNNISLEIVKKLENPIISTSLNISREEIITDPNNMTKEMKNKIDIIIDAGPLPQEASSIIDLSSEYPQIIREGKGDISYFK